VAAAAKAHVPLTVALLGRSDGARELLRHALEDLGAEVVFEGDPAGLPPEQVMRSGAQVVLVNLASGVEDDIDHLQPLFDDPKVNVVFNEADVSSQLAGWDLARWARHLAAKVIGHGQTIPPPPPGSEPLPLRNFMPVPGAPPTPAQETPERAIEEFMIEAEDRVDAVPSDHLPYASGRRTPAVEEPVVDFRIDVNEVEGALAQIGSAPHVEERSVPEPEVPEILVHEDEAAEFDAGLDLAALDAALEIEARPAPTSGKSDAALLEEALSGLSVSLDPEAEAASASGTGAREGAGAAGFDAGLIEVEDFDSSDTGSSPGIEMDDFDGDGESISFGTVTLDGDGLELEPEADSGLLDDDVAALAAQLDALDASAPRGEVRDLEFGEFDDAPQAPAVPRVAPSAPAAAAPAAAPGSAPPRSFDLSGLDLAPIDDGLAAAPAPDAGAKKNFDFSGIDFSLEPTEEELQALATNPVVPEADAPPLQDPDVDALLAAMDLAPSRNAVRVEATPGEIRRVIVLGASIGGPDALRSFLGGIPEGFPALFVLVQHLESGFFERLAQQLQKASKLPVRVPDAGSRAVAGEVLVVPARQRVQIERNGQVALVDHAATPKYTPCIDDVMRDIADRFGNQATAIIFSGMAGDAIEGAVYLTTQGGEVWAQDPASCVVSSMVDGARARGVVEFVGSPRELADHCVSRYGRG
jgi:hypothetical protein